MKIKSKVFSVFYLTHTMEYDIKIRDEIDLWIQWKDDHGLFAISTEQGPQCSLCVLSNSSCVLLDAQYNWDLSFFYEGHVLLLKIS